MWYQCARGTRKCNLQKWRIHLVTLPSKNLTRNALRLNLSLQGEKPSSTQLSGGKKGVERFLVVCVDKKGIKNCLVTSKNSKHKSLNNSNNYYYNYSIRDYWAALILLWSRKGKRKMCYFAVFHTVLSILLVETNNGAERKFVEKKVVWLEVGCRCEVWSTNIALKYFFFPTFPRNPKGHCLFRTFPGSELSFW
jgi:hypothetical protein